MMEGLAWFVWSLAICFACFLCTQQLTRVLNFDAMISLLIALTIFFFPSDAFAWVYPHRRCDALHQYLYMQVVLAMLVPSVVWILSTVDTDFTLRTAHVLSRVMNYYAMFLPLMLVTMVYSLHLYYHAGVTAATRYGHLNIYFNTDLLFTTMCALICICGPEGIGFILTVLFVGSHLCELEFSGLHFGNSTLVILKGITGLARSISDERLFCQEQTLDGLHVYLYRLYGVIILGYTCLPWIAPRFRFTANKKAVLRARALLMLVTLVVTFYKYLLGDIPSCSGSLVLTVCLIAMTLPSLLGSMRYDQGTSWDLPWRGLHFSGVAVDDLYKKAKDEVKKVPSFPRRHLWKTSISRHLQRQSRR